MKPSTLLSISALVAPIFCGVVTFEDCNNSQEATLREALQDAELLSKAAATASEGGHGKTHAWFGSGDSRVPDETINIRFHKMANILSSSAHKDVKFICRSDRCCNKGSGAVPACQNHRGEEDIRICGAFWNWPLKQRVYELAGPSSLTAEPIDLRYRTRGYAVVHELTHSLFGTNDTKHTVTDKDGNAVPCVGYGHYCVLKYAQWNPAKARKNADSYALFATAAYYGINKFQTDPEKLNRNLI